MNQPLCHAIHLYQQRGEQFADLIPWHTLHGVAVIDSDCVLLGYYADHRDLQKVCDKADADTLFISYFGGNFVKLFGTYGDIEFIAYERIRARGRYHLRKAEDFLKRLTNQNHGI